MNNVPAFVQLTSMSFQMYFLLNLWLQIRFPLKCHCKEIYHFMPTHQWSTVKHILISEPVSVYCRDVVGLLSVCIRVCRSAVGYDSSIVLMMGFQSGSCRLSIGLKSGDSIPNLTRNDPDMNPTGFAVSSATLWVADSCPAQ